MLSTRLNRLPGSAVRVCSFLIDTKQCETEFNMFLL